MSMDSSRKKKQRRVYDAQSERQNNIIGKQLTALRKEQKMTLAIFKTKLEERGINISIAGINKWENGGSINAYQFMAICDILGVEDIIEAFTSDGVLTQLNPDGLRKLFEYRDDLLASGRYSVDQKTGMRAMPYVLLKVSAGIGVILDDEYIEMREFPANEIPDGADFAITVSGNSMEPVYFDGDLVWVQQCNALRVGDIGIFNYDGEGYIKVYNEQKPPKEYREAYIDSEGVLHKQPVLVSYNVNYPPREIYPNKPFEILGRVLHNN